MCVRDLGQACRSASKCERAAGRIVAAVFARHGTAARVEAAMNRALAQSFGGETLPPADAGPKPAAPMQPVDLSEVPTSDPLVAKDDATPKGPQSTTDLAHEEAAMLMSGVKVELINWQAVARPAESALVGIVILLLAFALFE